MSTKLYLQERCGIFRTLSIFRDKKKIDHYWRYFCQFSKHFEYKIDHFSKNRNRKFVSFIGFRTQRIFMDQKPNMGTFEGQKDGRWGLVCMSLLCHSSIIQAYYYILYLYSQFDYILSLLNNSQIFSIKYLSAFYIKNTII